MTAWCRLVLALLAVIGTSASSLAQNVKGGDESRIRIGVASTDGLRADVKYLIDLAPNAALRKNWAELDDTIAAFAEGVDGAKPLEIDFVFGATEAMPYWIVPVAKFDGRGITFVNNVKTMFKVAGPDGAGLYTLSQAAGAAPRGKAAAKKPAAPAAAAKSYFMRHIHGHALISERKADLPANAPNPAPGVGALVGNRDVVTRIENTADTLEARRKNFDEFRKQIEAAIKFKRDERETEFELRKLAARHTFDEAQRFLLESKLLEIGWTTDEPKQEGRGSFKLEALPSDDPKSLEQSVKLLAKSPSYFANVKLHEQPVLGLKANFAIDAMRSDHAKELYATLRPAVKPRIDDRPTLNAEGKEAAKKAADQFLDMLEAARELNVLDVFINLHEAEDKHHTGVCGIRCVDGDKAIEIIKLFPEIREGWKVTTDVAEHASVNIHEVTVAPHRVEEFKTLFGGDPIVYVGTSEKAVWGAAGINALDELKTAIDQSQQDNHAGADPEFFQLTIKFGALVDLLDVVHAHMPKKDPPDRKDQPDEYQEYKDAEERDKQLAKLRKLAKEAFAPGDGILEASLRRNDDVVEGEMLIHKGVLRFLGSATAHVYEENFR